MCCRLKRISPTCCGRSRRNSLPTRQFFPPYDRRKRAERRRSATTVEKSRGRIERRTIHTSTNLDGHLDWPGAAQVFLLIRERTEKGETTREATFGVTSLSPYQADAERLLTLIRGHWTVENRCFRTRDVTFGEDGHRVRRGNAPQIFAALRNAVITLLRCEGEHRITAAVRRFAYHPHRCFTKLGIMK